MNTSIILQSSTSSEKLELYYTDEGKLDFIMSSALTHEHSVNLLSHIAQSLPRLSFWRFICLGFQCLVKSKIKNKLIRSSLRGISWVTFASICDWYDKINDELANLILQQKNQGNQKYGN